MVPSDLTNKNTVYSMTGYGEGEVDLAGARIKVSIRTLNHDGTSVKIRGLREDQELAHKAEKFIKESFPRGRIEVKIRTEEGKGMAANEFDLEAIKNSFSSLAELTEELGLSEGPGLDDLIALDLLKTDPLYRGAWSELKQGISMAVEEVRAAQRKEGESIREDLLSHLDEISSYLEEAEEEVPGVVRQYKEELKDRVEVLLDGDVEMDRDRLEQEVATFAEKIDVTEEISRAKSHVETAKDALSDGGIIGKKLEFIRQELHREINTLGAKSKDGGIQSKVIEMKLSLDKFKEQSRNIA